MPGKKRKQTKPFVEHKRNNEIIGILLIGIGLFAAISTYTTTAGLAGYHIKNWLMGFLGIFAFIAPISLILFGSAFIFHFGKMLRVSKLILFIGLMLISMSIVHLFYLDDLNRSSMASFIQSSYIIGTQAEGAGVLLSPIIYWMYILMGGVGSLIFLTVLFFVLLLLLTSISINRTLSRITWFLPFNRRINPISKDNSLKDDAEKNSSKTFVGENIPVNDIKSLRIPELFPLKQAFDKTIGQEKSKLTNISDIKVVDFQKDKVQSNLDLAKSAEDNPIQKKPVSTSQTTYSIPPLNLLKSQQTRKAIKQQDKDVLTNARLLEETLLNFGISAKVVQISRGPAITRYELQPAPGIKVSRIVSLSDDIALSLAAQSVRIEAPIPGKAAIGIEIPNNDVTPVLLKEVLESEEFALSPSKLVVGLGKDIAGNNVVTDISRMPHLLIAGATGSGKSVCVNTLIVSILYKATPDDVKILMIDPKVVELNHYNGIPHLLLPVVTDPKKAAGALNWVVQEMINRYKLFADKGTRDLERYNECVTDKVEKLPQILVIIDELADLMMVAPADVEDAICRLAQMARASGIHLVIATQRPSVDVITGVIKANIPSRISFYVSSYVDSRTILDMGGAEKLLGRGDMLFYPVGLTKPIRMQGAYISEKEVEAIVSQIKGQNKEPEYNELIIDEINSSYEMDASKSSDELLPQAIEIAVDLEQISISMIQRRLRVGYARAARLIDEMEMRGIISGADGSKPRNVLITKDSLENLKGGF